MFKLTHMDNTKTKRRKEEDIASKRLFLEFFYKQRLPGMIDDLASKKRIYFNHLEALKYLNKEKGPGPDLSKYIEQFKFIEQWNSTPGINPVSLLRKIVPLLDPSQSVKYGFKAFIKALKLLDKKQFQNASLSAFLDYNRDVAEILYKCENSQDLTRKIEESFENFYNYLKETKVFASEIKDAENELNEIKSLD